MPRFLVVTKSSSPFPLDMAMPLVEGMKQWIGAHGVALGPGGRRRGRDIHRVVADHQHALHVGECTVARA